MLTLKLDQPIGMGQGLQKVLKANVSGYSNHVQKGWYPGVSDTRKNLLL